MTDVYLEVGKKKTFAVSLDWPGWARSGRGGRDRDKMIHHLLDAETSYLRMIGLKYKPSSIADAPAIDALRTATLELLGKPSDGQPLRPNGWPARFAARRLAWHVLDHLGDGRQNRVNASRVHCKCTARALRGPDFSGRLKASETRGDVRSPTHPSHASRPPDYVDVVSSSRPEKGPVVSARTLEERMTKVEKLTDERYFALGKVKKTVDNIVERTFVLEGKTAKVQEGVDGLYLSTTVIKNRLDVLDGRVEAIDGRLSNLEGDMREVKATVHGLDKRMDAFQTTLEAMQTTMKSMNTTNESVAMSLKVIAEKVGATQK